MDLEGAFGTPHARIEPIPHDVPHEFKDLPPRTRRRGWHRARRPEVAVDPMREPRAGGERPGLFQADRMAGYVERGEIPASSRWSPGGTMSTSTSSAHWRSAHPRPSGAPFNLKIVGAPDHMEPSGGWHEDRGAGGGCVSGFRVLLPKIEIEKLGVETAVVSLKREPVEIYSFFARIGLLDVQKTIREADPSDYAGCSCREAPRARPFCRRARKRCPSCERLTLRASLSPRSAGDRCWSPTRASSKAAA